MIKHTHSTPLIICLAVLLLLCVGVSPSSLLAHQSSQNTFLDSIDHLSEANDFGFKHLPFLHVEVTQAQFDAIEQRYITQYNSPDSNVLAWQQNSDGTHMNATGYVGIGLGSYIWYGANNRENYVEDWPTVAQALQSHDVTLPAWALGVCPWSNEADFDAANTPGSPYYADIQALNTTLQTDPAALDVQFRFGPWARLLRGVTPNSDTPGDYMFGYDPIKAPNALISLPPGEAELIGANFSAVSTVQGFGHPLGMYALVDYDNFKGEGTAVTEIHNTQHWGESAVLEKMGPLDIQIDPLTTFINSGLEVLHDRIVNTEMENKRNNTPIPNDNYDPNTDPIKYWTFFQNHLNAYLSWPGDEANQ
jgi:hypothetical protein